MNLFDPELRVRKNVDISASSRLFLLDLERLKLRDPQVLASACKALPLKAAREEFNWMVEAVEKTPAMILLHSPKRPRAIALAGNELETWDYSAVEKLLWIRLENESRPRELTISF